ncbi:MAG: hypothetical protein CVU00_02520, partial [Bacteroidetes bacterium HGW-Bacteroidetes-17]
MSDKLRLSEVAVELNLGISTILEVLNLNGFIIEPLPNRKLSVEQYEIIEQYSLGILKTTMPKHEPPKILGKIELPTTQKKFSKFSSLEDLKLLRVKERVKTQIINKNEFGNSLNERGKKSFSSHKKELKFNSLEDLGQIRNLKKEFTSNNQSWNVGQIKDFNQNKGFGFVTCWGDGIDYFIHISNIKLRTINKTDFVVFLIRNSSKSHDKKEAFNLTSILDFDEDLDYLLELYSDYSDRKFRVALLSNPIIDYLRIAELELNNYNPNGTKVDFSVLLQNIILLLDNIISDSLSKGVTKLISEWAKLVPTGYHQILLWNTGILQQLPDIKTIKESFNDIEDPLIKTKIINAVPILSKISLLDFSLQNGLKKSTYYSNLFKIIESLIKEKSITIFDLEYDGHIIKEMAFSHNNNIETATTQNDIENLLLQFKEALLTTNSFIAGHNIEKFDIPILNERFEMPTEIGIIDTLCLETLLSPTLKSFALNTKHNAKDDVEHTKNLLTNQIIRLIHVSENQFKRFEKFIDSKFLKIIYQLRENISERNIELFKLLEIERDRYFIIKETGSTKAEEFRTFLNDKTSQPTFIITPKEFYPLLVELPNIQFSEDSGEYSKIIS